MFAGLFDLASEKDFVENGIDLVKVKHEIQLADIAKEGVEDFDEQVYCFEMRQFVVLLVDADAEKKTGIATVDELVVAELDKVALVLLIARRNQSVHLAAQAYLFIVLVGHIKLAETRLALSVLDQDEADHDGVERERGVQRRSVRKLQVDEAFS